MLCFSFLILVLKLPILAEDVRLEKFVNMSLRVLSGILAFSFLIHSSCSQGDSVKVMPVTTDSELALEFYKTGLLGFDQLKLEMAYHNLELALEEDPNFFMAHFWMYFMSSKKYKKVANAALMTESELGDGEKEIRTAFKYLLDGQDEKVVEHLQNAIDLYPRDPHLHKILYILQLQYFENLEAAEKSVKRAIEACPDYALAYNQLGYNLMYLEKYEEAEEAFDIYLEMSPTIANPHDSKGDFYMATEQYDLAYKCYMRAYEIDPTFSVSQKKALKAINLYNSNSKENNQ